MAQNNFMPPRGPGGHSPAVSSVPGAHFGGAPMSLGQPMQQQFGGYAPGPMMGGYGMAPQAAPMGYGAPMPYGGAPQYGQPSFQQQAHVRMQQQPFVPAPGPMAAVVPPVFQPPAQVQIPQALMARMGGAPAVAPVVPPVVPAVVVPAVVPAATATTAAPAAAAPSSNVPLVKKADAPTAAILDLQAQIRQRMLEKGHTPADTPAAAAPAAAAPAAAAPAPAAAAPAAAASAPAPAPAAAAPAPAAAASATNDAAIQALAAAVKAKAAATAAAAAPAAPAPAPAAAEVKPATPVAAAKPASAGAGSAAPAPAPAAAASSNTNNLNAGLEMDLGDLNENKQVDDKEAAQTQKYKEVLAKAREDAKAAGRGNKKTYSAQELQQFLERVSDLLHKYPTFRSGKHHELVAQENDKRRGGAQGGDDGGKWEKANSPRDFQRGGRGGRDGDRGFGGRDDRRGGDRRGGGYGGRGGRGYDDEYDDGRDYAPGDFNDLKRADNPYRVGKAGLDPVADLAKSAMGILNKISRETFDRLSEQMLQLSVTSQEMLEKIIDVVFDKALDDVFFQDLYADLCKRLGDRAAIWSDRYLRVQYLTGDAAPAGDAWYIDLSGKGEWAGPYDTEEKARQEGRHQTNFKRLLLNRCQMEFMKDSQFKPLDAEEAADKEEEEKSKEEGGTPLTAERIKELAERAALRDQRRSAIKRRMLANISFIGQLYKIDVLTGKIIHFCVSRLLAAGKIEQTDEESIEALCKLLTLIGGKLETEDKLTAGEGTARFNLYGPLLESLSRAPHLSKRVQFAVKDIIDLRKQGWQLTGSKASLERQTLTLTRDELRKKQLEEEKAKASAAQQDSRGMRGGAGLSNLRQMTGSGGPGSRPGAGAPAASGPRPRGPASFMAARGGGASASAAGAGGKAGDGWQTVGGKSGSETPKEGAEGASSSPAASDAAASGGKAGGADVLEGEALHRRLRGVIEEYVGLKSATELETSIKEVQSSPAWSTMLVSTALGEALKSKGEYREGASQALLHLAKADLLVKKDAVDGIKAFAPAFNDAAADAPNLAGLIAPMLAPLIACGFFKVSEIALVLDNFVPSKQAAFFGAVLLGTAAKLARAGLSGDAAEASKKAHDDVMEAARKHTVSLVALSSSGKMPLKKGYDTLLAQGGEDGAALQAAYPETNALVELSPKIQSAVKSGDVADLTAAVEALPAEVKTSKDFARGLVEESAYFALQSAYGDLEKAKKSLGGVLPLLRTVVRGVAGATPIETGIYVLNGLQVAVAASLQQAKEDGEDEGRSESEYGEIVKAVLADVGLVVKDAVKAWGASTTPLVAEGGAATFWGRAAALSGAAGVVSSL